MKEMPTIKQKIAFKEVGVNGGNISQAMKVAGYSESVSKRTDKLTNTNGWQELIDKHLSDEKLTKVHAEGLKAGKHIYKNNNESGEIEDMGVEPDYATRHKYLDSAYKLKGSYAPDKNININMNVKSIDPTDETIINSLKTIQEKLENE